DEFQRLVPAVRLREGEHSALRDGLRARIGQLVRAERGGRERGALGRPGAAAERIVRIAVRVAVVEVLDLLDAVDLDILQGTALRPVDRPYLEGGGRRQFEGEAGGQLVLVRQLGAGDDVRLLHALGHHASRDRLTGRVAARPVRAAGRGEGEAWRG